jgi:RimJ/RimL family protein N-acetyltransferase
VVAYGFEVMGLREIVSFTSIGNLRSRRVMEKLGMQRLPLEDFDHPRIPEGHHLRRHVLYRLKSPLAA